jgi:hypothetical protein
LDIINKVVDIRIIINLTLYNLAFTLRVLIVRIKYTKVIIFNLKGYINRTSSTYHIRGFIDIL